MSKTTWILTAILFFTFILQIVYCWNLPLSGDESVSLLQAAGKAAEYPRHIPHLPTPIRQIRSLMEYTPGYGISKVLESMVKEGMHPPFYYLFLHLLLRTGIDNPLFFRFFSILFSCASVYLLYCIAKALQNEKLAWAAAALLAVSAYGIHHSGMVRPYPLLMFLSLLSTWLVLQMETASSSRRFLMRLALYTAVIVVGLYTLYHFVFVICFQFFYCLLLYRRHIRQLACLILSYVLTAALYLPWLPSFQKQLHIVRSGTYYFHTTSHPLKFLAILYDELFAGRLFDRYNSLWVLFFFLAAPIALLGLLKAVRSRRLRRVLAALAVCILFQLLTDWKVNSHTLATAKFLFFVMPMSLIFLAEGLAVCWTKGFSGKLLAVLAAAMICLNTLAAFRMPQTVDGPASLNTFPQQIHRFADARQPLRLILNKENGRFVLSVAHALRLDCEIMAVENIHLQENFLKDPSLQDSTMLAVILFETPQDQADHLKRQAEQAGFSACQIISCRQGPTEDFLLLLTRCGPT